MKNDQIRNIIFDLGDVILNIDVPIASKSFADLSGREQHEILTIFKESEIFRQFETGLMDEPTFRNYVREILNFPDLSDEAIDTAWNSLLLDLPPERVELLKKLAKKYRLFLLSNTSSIHITQVNKILEASTGIEKLEDLFEIVFLSYEMGLMKPDPRIYQEVLAKAGLKAEETLFLDDNADNIRSASQLGIETIHVQKPVTILEYLKDYAV
ncbi:putative hydrolase of the HAD superfamily [Dyadobacter sp. BE34]|uniref:Hydrolase of the HAD superfamily n=1 Tax=Dyadobacter fermentans TaxID=94254 RepID=A0ABU1R6F3_9BACT|nr:MULTISPECIES: HAD family phosphatase [Dyadobacter]MDR6808963.1 putative hydrolase of the HAD superfamily [Dyadobacter fermentans]MDR7046706.1 putative hydrolase of the HAD superfamily [Dyadobacter sp. BE242]MDR7201020.1 putative hydrolase of the HAD superfamily [Dyadobacter sp. BE34]MDR7218980.1 putative hydrolase of the HAD superfamily [Dyadobacter sp. BE31]MDR7264810.1 putative hydrolase of the HAD superfamily [Dyadobacter sp. BE32]